MIWKYIYYIYIRNEDVDFAFWTDRHGEQNIYFTGANKNEHVCGCHFDEKGCVEEDTLVCMAKIYV